MEGLQMSNCEVIRINEFNDPFMHFAIFLDCDLTIFEMVVKEQKWQKVMVEEITTIRRMVLSGFTRRN